MSASAPAAPPATDGGAKHERDFEDELGEVDDDKVTPIKDDAVHFCLLAEFDIDAGATLAHQYPYPTGTDEQ